MHKFLIVLAALAALGVAAVAWSVSDSWNIIDKGEISAEKTDIEPLYGMEYRPGGMAFQVRSTGCTDESYFEFQVAKTNPKQVYLIRTKQDPCDAVETWGTWVEYSYEEMGISSGDKFRIANEHNECECL